MVLTQTTWNNTKAEIDVSSEDPSSSIYFNMGVCQGGGLHSKRQILSFQIA